MPIETPLREQHEKAGAKLGVYFDCLLPESFTSPEAEYRIARESVAVADKNYRMHVYFEGPDRARYLNAILSNNIKDLAPGQGNASLLLNPQGHILAEVETYALVDRLLAVSHAMVRERTVATFDKFIIMDDVQLDDATDQLAALSLEGPLAAKVLRGLGGPELSTLGCFGHTEGQVASIPCRIIRRSPGGVTCAEFIFDRSRAAELWNALVGAAREHGGGPMGYAALNILRLEAGVPWFGYDFDDKVIPQEAALESSHLSYTKGCYTGQEIVERVRSRGHVNRRRVGLQFAGAGVPERGAKIFAGEAEAGFVTRAAFSPALGRVIGMGYIRREHNATGSKLTWSGGEAEGIELPLAAANVAPRT